MNFIYKLWQTLQPRTPNHHVSIILQCEGNSEQDLTPRYAMTAQDNSIGEPTLVNQELTTPPDQAASFHGEVP